MLSIVLIFFSLTVANSVTVDQTTIRATRNPTRDNVCTYYKTNFTDQQRASTQSIIDAYTYLSDQQIQSIIFEYNFESLPDQLIWMTIPHGVCLVVLIFMWPGLCCCCSRPDRNPACKKFRKDPKEMYAKCELKWPAYVTVILYLAILAGGIVGLMQGPNISNYYNNFGCKILAIADDTLYGRISPSNQEVFFIGLKPFEEQLKSFDGKLSTFYTESSGALSSATDIRTKQQSIKDDIQDEYSTYNNILYTSAFRQSDGVTYTGISSEFKDMYYGPVSDSSKILGNINTKLVRIFSEVNQALDPMIDAWDDIDDGGTAAITSQISDTTNNITYYEKILNKTIQYYQFFDNPQFANNLNLGFSLVYGIIVGLAALGLIGAILLAGCTVVRARMIVYFTCGFLIFMGVITFVVVIGFAYLIPTLGQVCAYTDRQLFTSEGTVRYLSNLGFNDSGVLFTECWTNGTGNIIPQLSPSFTTSFQAIDLIADYTLQFNDLIPNFKTQNFDNPFNSASTVLQNVKTVQVLDFNNSIAETFLQGVAYKSFTVNGSCTSSSNVAGDSWVPSTQIISCQGGIFEQPQCLDLSSTSTCPHGCYQIYEQLTSPSGDSSGYNSNLNSRYGSGCNYAQYIIDLHDNWNLPRMTEMDNVQTDLNTLKTAVDDYDTSVKAIQASLNTFKQNLEANYDSQTNLRTGSFNGLECRVIGESIDEFRDSACVGVLASAQYNFIMLAIISYSILLLSCFSVCAGVRHYQHFQKMSAQVGYKGVPIAVSSKRINQSYNDD